MPIDQTIPGGAYRDAAGNWHDANGKPIRAPRAEDLPKVEETEQETGERSEDMITPGASLLDEFGKPEDLVDEDTPPETVKRKVTRKKS